MKLPFIVPRSANRCLRFLGLPAAAPLGAPCASGPSPTLRSLLTHPHPPAGHPVGDLYFAHPYRRPTTVQDAPRFRRRYGHLAEDEPSIQTGGKCSLANREEL